jgi:diguanylate cyclase (GGDEF)-like protein
MPRLAALGILALVVGGTSGVVAGAQPPPPNGPDGPRTTWDVETIEQYRETVEDFGWNVPAGLADRALGLLFEEITLLAELDALTTRNSPLQPVVAAFSPLDDVPRSEIVDALIATDRTLAEVKLELLIHADLTADPGLGVLDDFPRGWASGLATGTAPILAAPPYVAAVSMFLSQGTTQHLTRDTLGVEFIDLRAEVNRLVTGWGEAFANPDLGQRRTPSLGATLTLVSTTVAVTLLLIMLLRRRRAVAHGPDLSETVRRLISACSEQEVEAIAVNGICPLVDANTGVLLLPDSGGLRRAGSAHRLRGTKLDQVLRGGAKLSEVLEDDPALGGMTAAVLAVPIVAAGQVVGVLSVHRSADRLFGPTERSVVDRIGPSVAAALANVDRLGSMTELTLVDGLTSLGNRRRMDRDLEATCQTATDADLPVAFAMIDVDHFKQFNDTHGHAAGDTALKTVAATIAANVREADVVYRYGGEEFSVLLPDTTAEIATLIAERIRLAVEAAVVPGEQSQPEGRLTISVGVTTTGTKAAGELSERADRALYQAKQAGRNCIVAS